MSHAALTPLRLRPGWSWPAAWRARVLDCVAAEWSRLPLWLPVALGVGVVAYFSGRAEPGPAWLWLPWPLLATALALRGRRPLLAVALALAGAVALGFAGALWQAGRQPPVPELPGRAVVVTARVAEVDLLPEGRRLRLEGARWDGAEAPLERDIRIRLRANDPTRPLPGDTVRIRALLRPPSAPVAPGAWDFQRAAYFSGLAGSGFALGPVEVLATDGPAGLATLRSAMEARVTAAIPGAAGVIAAAMLTGSQSGIPAEAIAAMRDSGLAHLLSVSGLHVAIVIGLGFGTTRLLLGLVPPLALRLDGKAAAAVAGLMLGGFYTVLTGSQVPMLRSFAMAALGVVALLLGRRVISLRGLALAAALVMLWQPDALLGPSFQMSFGAVMALAATAEAMRGRLLLWRGQGEAWRRVALAVGGLMLTSLVAGAATTPFGLYHFGRLQLYGVAANALAVPITSFLIMPAGLAAALLMPLGLEGMALAPMGWGVEAVLWVAGQVASWPGAVAATPPIPAWGLAVLALGLCWLCLWRGGVRWLGVPLLAAGLASGLAADPPDLLVSQDGRLIALRTAEGVWLERASGASSFTRDSWLRAWGEGEAERLPPEGDLAGGAIRCASTGCVFRPRPDAAAAALLRAPTARRGQAAPPVVAEGWCGQARVLVSAEPIRGRCRETVVVDRFSVWRNGPHAVWLGPSGLRVLSDRDWRGTRPWVPPIPTPRPREPMAPAE
ncbi:ComEC family competence protein [Roseomonas sp. OT10]|uniref:ComEC/Rec2 family competence protein n=1 Tax=Roseomonas cutis TaxID=2897332 RepID=UPI001E3C157A|nr:ComEC/Rec2 family competence protein [Roseomonas sp. OT10]UFN50816.1 ComEC family competence protein [Roseomonas sp. OT10]